MSALRRPGAGFQTSALRQLALVVVLLLSVGCVPARGGWDVDGLERAGPELDALAGHRLGDLAPHFVPADAGLTLFLCRWELDRPLRVALPRASEARAHSAFLLALAAWEGALPGLRFVPVNREADIEIRIVSPGDASYVPAGAADTVADCRLDRASSAGPPSRLVRASLARASIVLGAEDRDALGRVTRLDEAELVGAALHELGHALGFAGHVAAGRSVMVATRETVRDVGARVVAGEPMDAPTLRALYALPSGFVVGSRSLAPGEQERFAALRARAEQAELDGPYTRVGDALALLMWRRAGRVGPSLLIAPWPDALRQRGGVRFEVLER